MSINRVSTFLIINQEFKFVAESAGDKNGPTEGPHGSTVFTDEEGYEFQVPRRWTFEEIF